MSLDNTTKSNKADVTGFSSTPSKTLVVPTGSRKDNGAKELHKKYSAEELYKAYKKAKRKEEKSLLKEIAKEKERKKRELERLRESEKQLEEELKMDPKEILALRLAKKDKD
jgi:hypothetical protein